MDIANRRKQFAPCRISGLTTLAALLRREQGCQKMRLSIFCYNRIFCTAFGQKSEIRISKSETSTKSQYSKRENLGTDFSVVLRRRTPSRMTAGHCRPVKASSHIEDPANEPRPARPSLGVIRFSRGRCSFAPPKLLRLPAAVGMVPHDRACLSRRTTGETPVPRRRLWRVRMTQRPVCRGGAIIGAKKIFPRCRFGHAFGI
jgi:hypothetical protein